MTTNQLTPGDNVVLDYLASRFDKLEDKFDANMKERRDWETSHAKEDRDAFDAISKHLVAQDATTSTTNNINAINANKRNVMWTAAGIIATILLSAVTSYGTMKLANASPVPITQTISK